MSWYEEASQDTLDVVAKVIRKHLPDYVNADVRVDVLMAHPKEDDAGCPLTPAITVAGYPCAAKIRKTNPKERARGLGDLEMILDYDQWMGDTDREREALVFHELCHFTVQKDKDGNVVTDDYERPKFVSRRHDHQFGWFNDVVTFYGENAHEWQQANSFVQGRYTQQWLPCCEPEGEEANAR